MIIETKKIYKCEYCRKLYQVKHFAEKHEDDCRKNPKNDRPCFNCQYLIKKPVCIRNCDDSCGGGAECERYSFFYCSEINSFIYPPYITGAPLVDDENEPMPKECKNYLSYKLL